MVATPAVKTAANVRENPNKTAKRKIMMPWHIAMINMSSNAFRVLTILSTAYGNDGKIRFKRETLSTLCHLTKPTLDRSIAELKKLKLIETERNGKSLDFYLMDAFWQDEPVLKIIPKSHHQCENRVITDDDSLIKEQKDIIKKKKTAPESDRPPKPIEKKSPSEQKPFEPSAVFFHKNTKQKLGQHSNKIAIDCAKIVNMPGYNDKQNPIKLVKWAISRNIHPEALADSLSFITTLETLAGSDLYAIVRNRNNVKGQKYNAMDAEKMCNEYKRQAVKNGKIVLVMNEI